MFIFSGMTMHSNELNPTGVIEHLIEIAHGSLDLNEIFREMAKALGKALDGDRCFISQFDDRRRCLEPPKFEYCSSESLQSILSADPSLWENLALFSERCCRDKESRLVEFQTDTAELSPELRAQLTQYQIQSGIGCAVRFEDHCIATLFLLQTRYIRKWTDTERNIFQVAAKQIAIAIHRAETYTEASQYRWETLERTRHHEVLMSFYYKALSDLNLSVLFKQAVEVVSQILGIEYVQVLEESDIFPNLLTIRAVIGFPEDMIGQSFESDFEPHAVLTLAAGKPIVVEDINTETRFPPSPLYRQFGIVSGLSAVIHGNYGPYGVLEADSRQKRQYHRSEADFLEALANILGLAIERKRAEEKAGAIEERFRILLEGVTDYAIFFEDPQGKILSWNTAAEHVYGYKAEDVIGKPFTLFVPQGEIEQGLYERFIKATREEGHFEMEGWRIRKDGSLFWANIVVTALHNKENQLIGLCSISRDMTPRMQTEQSLLEMQRQLEQSNQDLQHFAVIASHDLQSPLRKARTFYGMLKDSLKDNLNPEQALLFNRAEQSLISMQDLINDLLKLSRVEKVEPFHPVDLTQVVTQVLNNLSDVIKAKGAKIEVDCRAVLMGDSAQLTALLQNLVENALKFQAPEATPVIKIFSDCDSEEFCQISVQDNGIGFEQKDAERIFKMLERLQGKSAFPGTGIGLAICRRITERHGGSIRAISEPGKGSTFIVTLPNSLKEYEYAPAYL